MRRPCGWAAWRCARDAFASLRSHLHTVHVDTLFAACPCHNRRLVQRTDGGRLGLDDLSEGSVKLSRNSCSDRPASPLCDDEKRLPIAASLKAVSKDRLA